MSQQALNDVINKITNGQRTHSAQIVQAQDTPKEILPSSSNVHQKAVEEVEQELERMKELQVKELVQMRTRHKMEREQLVNERKKLIAPYNQALRQAVIVKVLEQIRDVLKECGGYTSGATDFHIWKSTGFEAELPSGRVLVRPKLEGSEYNTGSKIAVGFVLRPLDVQNKQLTKQQQNLLQRMVQMSTVFETEMTLGEMRKAKEGVVGCLLKEVQTELEKYRAGKRLSYLKQEKDCIRYAKG